MSSILAKLAYYKEALSNVKVASEGSQFDQMAQRIARTYLKKAVDREMLKAIREIGNTMLIAGFMGVAPHESFTSAQVASTIKQHLNGQPLIDYDNLVLNTLNKLKILSSHQDDLTALIYSPEDDNPAWKVGQYIKSQNPDWDIQDLISNKALVASLFKKRFYFLASDLLKSKPYQSSPEHLMEEERPDFTNVMHEVQNLSIMGDIDAEEANFLDVFMSGTSKNAENVRQVAMPFISKGLLPWWDHGKKLWSLPFAKDMIFHPRKGYLMFPGLYSKVPSVQLFLDWVKDLDPVQFEKYATRVKENFSHTDDGGDLIIHGLGKSQLGSALGSKGKDYIMSFSIGGRFFQTGNVQLSQSGNAVRIKGMGKFSIRFDESEVSSVLFMNVKTSATHISRFFKQFPHMLADLFDRDVEMQKALFPALMREDAFKRTVQGKTNEDLSEVPF